MDVERKNNYKRAGSCITLFLRREVTPCDSDRTLKVMLTFHQHVVSIMFEDCRINGESRRMKQWWLYNRDRVLIVTLHSLKYDLTALATTAQWCLSLSLAFYPPGAPVTSDVGMDKHVSSAGSDFQTWDPGIWEVGWGGGVVDHLSFSSPFLSTHPEQAGPGPCPGLNPFPQSDLREKHSSIPEKRSHIYRSSGNRRRLMKCRLKLRTKRELQCGTNISAKWSHREDREVYKLPCDACFSNQPLLCVLRCVLKKISSIRKYNWILH